MNSHVKSMFLSDIEAILSHRHDQGGDLWATPDKRLLKGAPFSTLESVLLLLELGMDPVDPLLKEAADLIFSTWQKDGRFKVYPKGSIYPCQTAHAVDTLCHLGYVADARIQKTFQHLLDLQYTDGGWRCNKFSFGRGPETDFSNPMPTLIALSVYVLSFYKRAKEDKRFWEAYEALKSKLVGGQIVVERVVPKLADFSFCKKGKPSVLGTIRYQEIIKNLG